LQAEIAPWYKLHSAMNGAPDQADPPPVTSAALPVDGVRLLLALRSRMLSNTLRQALRERPLRLLSTAASIVVIWVGLYYLLERTLRIVRQPVLEGIVATPLIFTFFFLALTAMLAFSSAILAYGGLFRRLESAFLMATPMAARDVVIVRYIESLVLSSWSLLLLGLPLMMALSRHFSEPWSFYPLFLGLFLLFIPVPGALGLVLAWTVAMVAPKTPRRIIILVAGLLLVLGGGWFYRIIYAPVSSSEWLQHFYDRIALVQNAMLPHTWVSKGINLAVQGQTAPAAFYLFVTAANALFASFVAVGLVSGGFTRAFARAQVSARGSRRSGRLLGWLSDVVFAYLPWRQRILAAKDLRSFLRDPLQWSQMAILIGLLALYVGNVQRWWVDLAQPGLHVLIAFLNQTAVCLILATFTSRFVFPIVSLEGQQLWLLGLLPLPRSRIIMAKFLFALTITLLAALAVMGISVYRLQLPTGLAVAHLGASVAVCIGLCGVSIGMGARMPIFTERNPARIAGGFGGTVSLLLSVALVVASLAGLGVMSLHIARTGTDDTLTGAMLGWLLGVVALNVAAAAAALAVGMRHFGRLEY